MEIVWLGHSALSIKSGGVTLITDPFSKSLGFPMSRQNADVVTLSNDHPHHAQCDAVDGDPYIINGPGEYEIGSFSISGMGTPLSQLPLSQLPLSDLEEPRERRFNTVYTIRAEGLTLCHLGDLTQSLSTRRVAELNKTDVLFAPVGGICTISAVDLVALVKLIRPRIVVPLHYRMNGVKVQLEPLDGFLKEMGTPETSNQPRLTVTTSNLPLDTSVVALQIATT